LDDNPQPRIQWAFKDSLDELVPETNYWLFSICMWRHTYSWKIASCSIFTAMVI